MLNWLRKQPERTGGNRVGPDAISVVEVTPQIEEDDAGGLVNIDRDRAANLREAADDKAAVQDSEESIKEFLARLPSAMDHGGVGRVAKIFHFVYGFHSPGDIPYFGYIAIRSALFFNPGWSAFLYCMYQPNGRNWDRLKERVTLIPLRDFKYFMGSSFHHYAHKADVIRMIVMNRIGGVYLDMDTITQRSFEDLSGVEFCMGAQAAGPDSSSGLCNAVMVGQAGAGFSNRWIAQYDYFRSKGRDDLWDYHSVKLPGMLMSRQPETITVLDYRAFFFPLWNTVEKILLTDSGARFIDEFSVAYCFHLWHGSSGQLLSKLDHNYIRNSQSIYASIARKVEGFDA